VKQTIEVGATASEDKTREPAPSARTKPGPKRHGSERQTPATCFAAPSFLFAEPVLLDADVEAGLKPCATDSYIDDHGPAEAGHYVRTRETVPGLQSKTRPTVRS
jgi:hypothetical protein